MSGSKMSWIFAGTMVVTLVLAACGGGTGAEVDLVGTDWTLTELEGEKPLADTTVTANFGDDGSLSGSSACNSYSTTYEVNGNKVAVSEEIAATMMMCEEEVMDQEQAYVAALASSATYEIRGNELAIKDAGGNTLLTFSGN